ncbi:hypothetical protein [Sandaracinus amylolyticus]|uniref:Uncharacterized protein n=1 Tax=Sandaracinus amylolyticus TaxID=927083 RepID=A0A0F6SI03_9BACT|nr:hypothetical protein [Sandaracinus amylolyticus]AKF11344.1 hypothetical protein DB32_008493 [Sandaracinus amylolyticus]
MIRIGAHRYESSLVGEPREEEPHGFGWLGTLTLVVRRADAPGALRIEFDGTSMDRDGAAGAIIRMRANGPEWLPLHATVVRRCFIEAALAAGWDGERAFELDGWTLYDDALARIRAREPRR